MPNDIDGPHGLAFAPDGQSYFVTFAHGQPNGTLWRLAASDDRVLGHVTLGMFPATAQVTPDGEFAFVVNFNLHGDRIPSSVSVVATGGMLEVARIPTCLMPHGSRINAEGTKHYSACMMDDTLVEIDTRTLKVARHFTVTRGSERGASGAPVARPTATQVAHGGHGTEPPPPGERRVLADLGAAVERRPARVRGVQRVERDRGDRRGRRGRSCGVCPPGQVSTTSP